MFKQWDRVYHKKLRRYGTVEGVGFHPGDHGLERVYFVVLDGDDIGFACTEDVLEPVKGGEHEEERQPATGGRLHAHRE